MKSKLHSYPAANRAEIDSGIRSIGWDGMVLIERDAGSRSTKILQAIWNQPIRADQISGLLEMIRTDYFPVCFVCADQIFLNNRDGSVEQLGVEPSLEEGQMDPRASHRSMRLTDSMFTVSPYTQVPSGTKASPGLV